MLEHEYRITLTKIWNPEKQLFSLKYQARHGPVKAPTLEGTWKSETGIFRAIEDCCRLRRFAEQAERETPANC